MSRVRTAVVDHVLDPTALLAEVASTDSGASTVFVGTVRRLNDDREVTGIDYSAYTPMAEKEMADVVALGEASIVIAVSHPRRSSAMGAQKYVIEQLKKRVPIWKREHYADGAREWVDPTRVAPADSKPSGIP